MSSYYIEMTFDLGAPADDARAAFEAHLDDVADAFEDLADVDGDVGTDLSVGRVDLCMTLAAGDRIEALARAVAAARTAIHAAGGATPGWDHLLSRLIDDDDYELRSAKSSTSGFHPDKSGDVCLT